MRISDWSSDVCSSDLKIRAYLPHGYKPALREDEMPSCPAGAKGAGSYSMFYNGFLYSVRGLQSPTRSEKAYADGACPPFIESLGRSEEHTSELQSLMRISYAVFCLTKKTIHIEKTYIRSDLTSVAYKPS